LQLEYSRARYPRADWRHSIIDARARLDDKLSPSLRLDLEQQLARLWRQARTKAENALRGHREADAVDLLPSDCPYALDDLLTDGRYPASLPRIAEGQPSARVRSGLTSLARGRPNP
jgi:hypothetical protein